MFEIIEKGDIAYPRLTVAKDRVSIKMPKVLGHECRLRVINLATTVALRLSGSKNSVRGTFLRGSRTEKYTVSMSKDNGELAGSFSE